MSQDRPRYAAASALYRASTPSELVRTSQEIGWTSVLLEVHRVTSSPDIFEHGATPDQTIVVQSQGRQELESLKSGRWHRSLYKAGTVGLTPPMHVARLRRRVDRHCGSFEKINLYIPQAFFDEATDHYKRIGQRRHTSVLSALAFTDPLVAQTVFSLRSAMDAGAPDLHAQVAVQWLAIHLLSEHSSWAGLREDRRCEGRMPDSRVARISEYMATHFRRSLTLEELASECAVSKFHFARLFRRATGFTPHGYLSELRLEAAHGLLCKTDIRVNEIAAQCGFSRSSHFAVAFKKRYGVAPSRVRLGAAKFAATRWVVERVRGTPTA